MFKSQGWAPLAGTRTQTPKDADPANYGRVPAVIGTICWNYGLKDSSNDCYLSNIRNFVRSCIGTPLHGPTLRRASVFLDVNVGSHDWGVLDHTGIPRRAMAMWQPPGDATFAFSTGGSYGVAIHQDARVRHMSFEVVPVQERWGSLIPSLERYVSEWWCTVAVTRVEVHKTECSCAPFPAARWWDDYEDFTPFTVVSAGTRSSDEMGAA